MQYKIKLNNFELKCHSHIFLFVQIAVEKCIVYYITKLKGLKIEKKMFSLPSK